MLRAKPQSQARPDIVTQPSSNVACLYVRACAHPLWGHDLRSKRGAEKATLGCFHLCVPRMLATCYVGEKERGERGTYWNSLPTFPLCSVILRPPNLGFSHLTYARSIRRVHPAGPQRSSEPYRQPQNTIQRSLQSNYQRSGLDGEVCLQSGAYNVDNFELCSGPRPIPQAFPSSRSGMDAAFRTAIHVGRSRWVTDPVASRVRPQLEGKRRLDANEHRLARCGTFFQSSESRARTKATRFCPALPDPCLSCPCLAHRAHSISANESDSSIRCLCLLPTADRAMATGCGTMRTASIALVLFSSFILRRRIENLQRKSASRCQDPEKWHDKCYFRCVFGDEQGAVACHRVNHSSILPFHHIQLQVLQV